MPSVLPDTLPPLPAPHQGTARADRGANLVLFCTRINQKFIGNSSPTVLMRRFVELERGAKGAKAENAMSQYSSRQAPEGEEGRRR
jgi:hypothetical protein